MKKILLVSFCFLLAIQCFSQIIFESGYYINDSNEKIECLIKNNDWVGNPTKFEFKLTPDAPAQTASIETVKEFGIINKSKYVREKVKIDRSTDRTERINHDRNPQFLEETLFLKVLIEGEASLFMYEDGDLKRFFYTINDNEIQQLVYKRFLIDNQVAQNNYFKQQLLNDLRCENIRQHDAERLKYITVDLEKFFIKFNECSSGSYISHEIKEKKDLFNLSFRPGLNYSKLIFQMTTPYDWDFDFDRVFSVRFGIEAEIILPFNKDKWSIIIEPIYHQYKSEKVVSFHTSTLTADPDYKSIELPMGVRHYFFLNDASKIFVNVSYVWDFTNNSAIAFKYPDGSLITSLKIRTTGNLAMGFGYKFKDRFSLEMRYQTSRHILIGNPDWTSTYQTASIIFGYSIF